MFQVWQNAYFCLLFPIDKYQPSHLANIALNTEKMNFIKFSFRCYNPHNIIESKLTMISLTKNKIVSFVDIWRNQTRISQNIRCQSHWYISKYYQFSKLIKKYLFYFRQRNAPKPNFMKLETTWHNWDSLNKVTLY